LSILACQSSGAASNIDCRHMIYINLVTVADA